MGSFLKRTNADVRLLPDTFDQCVVAFSDASKIDVALAKEQHSNYCKTLESLGVKLIKIEADDTLPDCCFTEDTAIIIDDIAIITRPGAKSRVAETIRMKETLTGIKKIFEIKLPGTIDGGDCLHIDKNVFIGLSARTNMEAIKQVEEILEPLGFKVIPVVLKNTLHLKCFCTYIGENTILLARGYFDESLFDAYNKIYIPEEESYATNCLEVNGTIVSSKGYPKTKALIEENGFKTVQLDMSEFKKADGSLTCLSVLF